MSPGAFLGCFVKDQSRRMSCSDSVAMETSPQHRQEKSLETKWWTSTDHTPKGYCPWPRPHKGEPGKPQSTAGWKRGWNPQRE